jgi:hypothetical protein
MLMKGNGDLTSSEDANFTDTVFQVLLATHKSVSSECNESFDPTFQRVTMGPAAIQETACAES